MRCPTCGFENSGTAKFCAECGARIAPASSAAQIPGAELSLQPTLGSGSPSDSPAALAGSESLIADRYQVQRTLGQGGMGAVYLATDTKPGMGGREVAIKRILDADDQGVQRFLRESETIAALNHQNIRAVYDRGEDAEGHFLVMEYIDGETLHERVAKNGALDDSAFIDLAQGLGKALSFAHKRSVIHRDVKPANVMFTGDGTPKLTDFGLARMGHESDLSMTGYGMGTLDYASPEQRRDAKSADHRSDVYGLGATLYFATTGESPKVVRSDRIPIRWRNVILKCLEEKPEIRYFSIDDFLRDFEQACKGSSTLDATTPSPSLTGTFACPSCGHSNLEQKRFCLFCGTGLFIICSACSEQERAGISYCGSCGAGLTSEAREVLEEREAAKSLNPFGWEVLNNTPGVNGAARIIRDPKTGITFVLVESGRFYMGASDQPTLEWERANLDPDCFDDPGEEFDVHPDNDEDYYSDETPRPREVTISKPFYLAETVVTQASWKRIMGSNPSAFQGDDLPVDSVSWEDCIEFCKIRGDGFRLPTEAEWEYSCRAGMRTALSSGHDGVETIAWSMYDDENRTHEVKEKAPNSWGFYDMHGNVREWCSDWYDSNYPTFGECIDPKGAIYGDERVYRGGGFIDGLSWLDAAHRDKCDPDYNLRYMGFRVVKTIP